MDIARIFESGNSQAIRLPKAYRFDTTKVKELVVRRYGDTLMLTPVEKLWENFVKCTEGLPEDFLSEDLRDRLEPEERGLSV